MRGLAAALALLLGIAAAISGCGGGGGATTTATAATTAAAAEATTAAAADQADAAETTAAPAAEATTAAAETAAPAAPAADGPFAEHMEIVWGTTGSSGAWIQPGSRVQQYLEERYNVTIIPWQVDANNQEAVGIKLAGGDMFDFGHLYKQVPEMARQGLIRPISKGMIQQYAPDAAAVIDAHPFGWKINKLPGGAEDEYGALTGYMANNMGFNWFNTFRLDWLEKVGVAPKGEVVELAPRLFFTEEAFTVDEFTDILEKFGSGDPDGNGQDDTYGLVLGWDGGEYNYAGFYGAFGLNSTIIQDSSIEENGRAVPVYASAAWKNFLVYLSGLAQKGLLDPEGITQDTGKAWEKITSGIGGYQTIDRGYAEVFYTDRPPHSQLAYNTEARVLLTPPMIGADGSQSAPQYVFTPYNYEYYVGAQVSDAKLERILRIWNDLVADEELFVYSQYGWPGENFDWLGEPWDSGCAIKATEDEGHAAGLGAFAVNFIQDDFVKFTASKVMAILMGYIDSPAGQKINGLKSYTYDLFDEFSEEKLADRDRWWSDREKLIRKFWSDAQMGMDVEASWDGYIADLKELGLDEYTELVNKWPVVEDAIK
jgi:hypothetical protein